MDKSHYELPWAWDPKWWFPLPCLFTVQSLFRGSSTIFKENKHDIEMVLRFLLSDFESEDRYNDDFKDIIQNYNNIEIGR